MRRNHNVKTWMISMLCMAFLVSGCSGNTPKRNESPSTQPTSTQAANGGATATAAPEEKDPLLLILFSLLEQNAHSPACLGKTILLASTAKRNMNCSFYLLKIKTTPC